MPLRDDCAGFSPHVAMVQRDHVPLEWREPYPVLERVRVTAWTCACLAMVYELCAGAGQGFIRRTVQHDQGHRVHQTRLWPIDEARAVWTGVLSGRAR
ncbi:hypothetical protein [Streptosporangium sandarakinum]|uniref:Uncharacterized protein n=1 Tax=Streptosporangium sandarakinum TaxID=1260955 RepID=A0A852UXW8_9ACTN|nr:hypothetical protein [Streptosporangium sandarakinum]NYF40308.1 hypothetical protein [Streptosporangium sandarakinum]